MTEATLPAWPGHFRVVASSIEPDTEMKFCSQCSAPVALRIPDGDALPRHVCTACGTIHYQNPKMVVGCIPEWEDKVLLCRRAIEPRRGMWTVPAGFMENGETTFQGAIRETLEEANARVEVDSLYALYNIPHISQVYLLFRARLLDLRVSQQEAERSKMRKSQVSTGDRSAKIRTYNWPQSRVTDHRINFTTHNLPGVMNGEIGPLIEAVQLARLEEDMGDQ